MFFFFSVDDLWSVVRKSSFSNSSPGWSPKCVAAWGSKHVPRGSMMYGCFLFCSCEWALCALCSTVVIPNVTLVVSWAEIWTMSERLLTVEQIKIEVVSVKEGNGNTDLCLAEISPYHLPFSFLTPSLVTSEMSGTVVPDRKSLWDVTWQVTGFANPLFKVFKRFTEVKLATV